MSLARDLQGWSRQGELKSVCDSCLMRKDLLGVRVMKMQSLGTVYRHGQHTGDQHHMPEAWLELLRVDQHLHPP